MIIYMQQTIDYLHSIGVFMHKEITNGTVCELNGKFYLKLSNESNNN